MSRVSVLKLARLPPCSPRKLSGLYLLARLQSWLVALEVFTLGSIRGPLWLNPKAAPSRRTPRRFAQNLCHPCDPWSSAFLVLSCLFVSIRG